MKTSIFIILLFFLLSSVTFSEFAVGGWDGELRHNGVRVNGDTIHVNYGDVVEIWFVTWGHTWVPNVMLFDWYLDDVLVPLENLNSDIFSGKYALNQPGKWVYRYNGPNNWSKSVVVVWDNEYVAEAFDPGQNFQLEEEEEFHPESDIPPTTIDILPNPTRDRIKLVSNSKLVQLNILNQAGVIVHSSSPGTNEAVVHLNHLARGLYFAEVISEHGDRTIKRILVVD